MGSRIPSLGDLTNRTCSCSGKTFPTPISGLSFSGKFMVRVPPDVHRALALKAAEQGVSLNRLVSAKLADQ